MLTIQKKKTLSFFGHQNFGKVLFETFPLEFLSCYEDYLFRHLFDAIVEWNAFFVCD